MCTILPCQFARIRRQKQKRRVTSGRAAGAAAVTIYPRRDSRAHDFEPSQLIDHYKEAIADMLKKNLASKPRLVRRAS